MLTARATAAGRSSSSAGGSYSTSTGYVRPSTCTTGAPPKNSEKRSVSMVAELMMTLRSGRSGRMRAIQPSKKSMVRLRSWASSMISVS